MKAKKGKITISNKENRYIEKYIPFGLIIGLFVGILLYGLVDKNTLYFIISPAGGLILAFIFGLIKANSDK